MATSSTIQMNVSFYMFLAQFLVKKSFFTSALVLIFSRETCAGEELIIIARSLLLILHVKTSIPAGMFSVFGSSISSGNKEDNTSK